MRPSAWQKLRQELSQLTPTEKARLAVTWQGFWARSDQIPPKMGDNGLPWRTFLALAGRGWGKTRAGAEWIHGKAEQVGRIALLAETAADARDVMVEGDSGIMACQKPWNPCRYNPSKRRIEWENGCVATTYSGDAPDQLRGPQHGAGWCDELCKYMYADEAWAQLQMGMRLGAHPQVFVTTTPRPMKLLKRIMKSPSTVIVRGSTYDNADNLANSFFDSMEEQYGGTRLGKQEIYGDLLEDVPGALWNWDMIQRVNEVDDLDATVVAVDPSGSTSGDAVGIVAAGRRGREYFVLADFTLNASPRQWARKAISLYDADDILADRMVGERNFGGDMVANTIRTEAENMFRSGSRDTMEINYRDVVSAKGKVLRAEPVAALYEQKRVFHVGEYTELEDEMIHFTPEWDRKKDGSPNRVDALVFAITELMRGQRGGSLFGGWA